MTLPFRVTSVPRRSMRREPIWQIAFAPSVLLSSPQQGFDSRQQLHHFKRFRQVVIGAEFQADDLIDGLSAGRQHQNRHRQAGLPDIAADVESVLARQHDVKNDEIVVASHGASQSFFPVARAFHLIAFAQQAIAQRHAQRFFVFDQKDMRSSQLSR